MILPFLSGLYFRVYRSEIFYAVKDRIVCVVVVMRAVEGCAAEEYDIVAFDLKGNVLKADMRGVDISVVEQIANDLPVLKIARAHKREQISRRELLR